MTDGIVLASRVQLVRNLNDLPFAMAAYPASAALLTDRTEQALSAAGLSAEFDLLHLGGMPENSRRALLERGLVSEAQCKNPDTAAVFLRKDDRMAILLGGEDQVCIRATHADLDLMGAAEDCFHTEDVLSREMDFAFDEALGYLTSATDDTGTGMRASLLLHLPMLTMTKQLPRIRQLVDKGGMRIRGVLDDTPLPLGALYCISNRVTLGRTEQEIIAGVQEMGMQLCKMEQELRDKALSEGRRGLEDVFFRARGALENARSMPYAEFCQHWSCLRLGAALGLMALPLEQIDMMLMQVQDAHLRAYAGMPMTARETDECRADRVRELLGGIA